MLTLIIPLSPIPWPENQRLALCTWRLTEHNFLFPLKDWSTHLLRQILIKVILSWMDGCVMEIKFTKTTCLKSGAFCSNTKIKIKTVGCHCKLAATFVVFTPTYFCQIVTKASSLLNILESIPETSQYSNNVEKVSYLKTH